MEVEYKITPKKTISTTSLGKTLRIGSKSKVDIMEPGYILEIPCNSVHMTIGIGNDNIGFLIMSEDALHALNEEGIEIHIGSIQEHIKTIKNVRKK